MFLVHFTERDRSGEFVWNALRIWRKLIVFEKFTETERFRGLYEMDIFENLCKINLFRKRTKQSALENIS